MGGKINQFNQGVTSSAFYAWGVTEDHFILEIGHVIVCNLIESLKVQLKSKTLV